MSHVSKYDYALTTAPQEIREYLASDSSGLTDNMHDDILGELTLNNTTLLGIDEENRRDMTQRVSNGRVNFSTVTDWNKRIDQRDTFSLEQQEMMASLDLLGRRAGSIRDPPPPRAAIPRAPGTHDVAATEANPISHTYNPQWGLGVAGVLAAAFLVL